MIARYQNDGTRYHRPNRVALMRKANLQLGVPDTAKWGMLEMFYDQKERQFYIDLKDEFDTQIVQDTQLVYAY